ncbi:MAG: hypothetical protein KKI02_12710, partial [Planctomycetes bacterium]|nr:hypothetical protein [Planctomycetota bacterium]
MSQGYDTVRVAHGGHLDEPGHPMLPTKTIGIALPSGVAVTHVRAVPTESADLLGEYEILPTQPPWVPSQPPREFVEPDPAVYASGDSYPADLVASHYQADLAGQAVVFVRICPLQYAPAEKELKLHTSIRIVLAGVPGYECRDYLPTRIPENRRLAYQRTLERMVVNPADVALCHAPTPTDSTRDARGVDPNEAYDYVIITDADWVDDWQSLADWKTKKGV